MKNFIKISGLIVILMVLGACSQAAQSADGEEEETVTPVEVGEVTRGDLTLEQQINGRAIANQQAGIVPNTSGELVALEIQKGDYVKQGQVIGRVDAGSAQDNVELQQLSVESAQKSVDSAVNQRQQAQQGLANAKKQLEAAKIQGNSNSSSSSVNVENAQIELDQAKKSLERTQELFDAGAVSEQELENAQVRVKQAENALQSAKNSSESGGSSSQNSVDQAEIGVQQAQQQLDSAQIGVEQAKVSLRQAQTQLAQAHDALNDAAITSNVSGQVVSVDVEIGDPVSNTQAVAQVVDVSPIKAEISVNAEKLPLFQSGGDYSVNVDPLGESFTASVSYISPVTNDTGLYPIEAVISNDEEKIKPGMLLTINMPETTLEQTLLVPTSAVVENSTEAFVYVVDEENIAVRKTVQVLEAQSDVTAVSGDLAEGDQVVTKGQITLDDGNKVQLIEEEN
ncbi:efflux RND transporter periplasmic adaptor subunit [Halobacillus litoralis]|uniref:efflux RND transporter periplasmic adaptor subunit n=1 Tax=Halobacillus litoralis TaxID=45668 RepID=UPI001CD615FC|nr:efflux RND transporter periplasmic adaptor subunit [Halobacillus litoralis]MCA0970965.1 efflux RND transporter periplasmic adaptor subunit [Halobacillus litoralis]